MGFFMSRIMDTGIGFLCQVSLVKQENTRYQFINKTYIMDIIMFLLFLWERAK